MYRGDKWFMVIFAGFFVCISLLVDFMVYDAFATGYALQSTFLTVWWSGAAIISLAMAAAAVSMILLAEFVWKDHHPPPGG